jgi:hypothetical protein
VKKTPTRQSKAPGDCDPELLSKQGRNFKIKNPQWITSQVVFWSQVLQKNRTQGCYEPGAKENKLFRQKPKTKEIFKGGSRNKMKVLHKKNI